MQQPEPSRYINSVSDLYGTDEIEFLLDDIRDLEPSNCNPEDIQVIGSDLSDSCANMSYHGGGGSDDGCDHVVVLQDFEIAGSRTGGCALSGSSGGVAAGGAECRCGGCEDCECTAATPTGVTAVAPLLVGVDRTQSPPPPAPSPGTVHSWDSHANYRHRLSASPDHSLFSGVIVYCDHKHLQAPTGFIRVLLVMTTVACLTCLCTSGTVKVGLFMLPLVGRLRLMMFVTLISLFVTSLLLFLDISHIIYLFPFNWGKVNAWLYVSISVLFLISSSLIFHMIFVSDSFAWVPKWTHQQLLVTGCLGYACCVECLILTLLQKCNTATYQPVAEDPSMILQDHPDPDHPATPPQTLSLQQQHLISDDESPTKPSSVYHYHNYKPVSTTVINYQQQITYQIASTSRQNPITSIETCPVPQPNLTNRDDVQPCSSKSVDPYRLA